MIESPASPQTPLLREFREAGNCHRWPSKFSGANSQDSLPRDGREFVRIRMTDVRNTRTRTAQHLCIRITLQDRGRFRSGVTRPAGSRPGGNR